MLLEFLGWRRIAVRSGFLAWLQRSELALKPRRLALACCVPISEWLGSVCDSRDYLRRSGLHRCFDSLLMLRFGNIARFNQGSV